MARDDGSGEPVTLGGPVSGPALAGGPLYVGPPDDPDRYELRDDGTRGGEGRTWRASYQGGLNNPLIEAVKMLFPPTGAGADWPTEIDVRRWRDNAALLRHLAQPHVVQLHDIFGGDAPHPKGRTGGRRVAYLTMEWVEGPTLAAHLAGTPVGPGSLAERLKLVEDVATAVAGLHSYTRSAGNPVLHRDLTPANCIVHADRGAVLIDISGMRLVDDGFDPLGRHTPAYTAPEVLRAPHEPRQPSSDLYAVGAVAVFVLTGRDPDADPARRPLLRESLSALLEQAGSGAATPAAAHLLELLDPDPAVRPTDVLAWSRTLTALATTPRRRRRPLLAGLAAAIVTVLVGVGAAYAVHRELNQPAAPSRSTDRTLGPVLDAHGYAPRDFHSTAGRIVSPSSGAEVRDCEHFTGTAAPLPAGQTLVVSQHNLAEPGNIRFIQVTTATQHPEKLGTWHSAQFFNDAAIGRRMLIELIQVPLTPELAKADDEKRYGVTSAIAARGKILAAVTVVHVDRPNPSPTCDMPAS